MQKWTRFDDMHVGGGRQTDYEYIYINLPRALAVAAFKELFGRDPEDCSCDHCGGTDFTVEELGSPQELTDWLRFDMMGFQPALTVTLSPHGEYVQHKGFPVLLAA